jgi:hypothetical protein
VEDGFLVLDYPSGFGDPRITVLGIEFHPNQCSGRFWVLGSGFGFGFGCPNTLPASLLVFFRRPMSGCTARWIPAPRVGFGLSYANFVAGRSGSMVIG